MAADKKTQANQSSSLKPHFIEVKSTKTSNSQYVEMKPELINSPKQTEKCYEILINKPPPFSPPSLNNQTTKFGPGQKENFCDTLHVKPLPYSRPFKIENKIVNTTTENEVCEIENKETSKKNVLKRYKNCIVFFLLFFMIIVAFLLGYLIFIVKSNNEASMKATNTTLEKYKMELIKSNENLEKLNNTLNILSEINQLNQSSINQFLTKNQPHKLDQFNVGMRQFRSDQHGNLKTITQDFYRGYKQLEDGWIALFNGFQYKKTIQAASWYDLRRVCQSWNADLVVYGVQDFGSRLLLRRALSLRKSVWVGITDEAKEGTWMWVNGKIAVNSSLFWGRNQPDDYNSNEDCAQLWVAPFYNDYLALNDFACNSPNIIAVCEKPI